MKVSDYVSFMVDRLPNGYVFTYQSFVNEVNKRDAVLKALNRMAASGRLARISRGKYYKPEKTPFGPILPDFNQVVKDLLEEDGKVVGYLTGFSIYNKLGFTTQVSSVIRIGRNQIRSSFMRERYKISFVKQTNTITKDNIPLLQILDIIRYIKKIPDTTTEFALKRLLALLKETPGTVLPRLVKLAMKYPPSTRALLGALLDQLGKEDVSLPLQRTLNPVSQYELKGADKVLENISKWYIK